jgi:hypothetical protein
MSHTANNSATMILSIARAKRGADTGTKAATHRFEPPALKMLALRSRDILPGTYRRVWYSQDLKPLQCSPLQKRSPSLQNHSKESCCARDDDQGFNINQWHTDHQNNQWRTEHQSCDLRSFAKVQHHPLITVNRLPCHVFGCLPTVPQPVFILAISDLPTHEAQRIC